MILKTLLLFHLFFSYDEVKDLSSYSRSFDTYLSVELLKALLLETDRRIEENHKYSEYVDTELPRMVVTEFRYLKVHSDKEVDYG